MSESIHTKDGRMRNYATVIYPDSAPSNWYDIITDMHIPVVVSPLHDKDVNPGPPPEPKKPHYHVLFAFEGKKTPEQARAYIDSINGVGLESVGSLRGYARYLCHLDNPEKAQYSTDDVKCFAGFDYFSAIEAPSDKYKTLTEIMDFIDENGITSFQRLMKYARNERMDWFRILCDSGTIVIKEYIKSYDWTTNKEREQNLHDELKKQWADNADK